MIRLNESIGVDGQTMEHLFEEVNGKKTMFLEGIMAQAERLNGNGRRYKADAMAEAVDTYRDSFVARSRAIGELNHPAHVAPNPERASQLITEVKMVGNDVVAKAKILDDMPMGRLVRTLYESGVNLGVSTRGLGIPRVPKTTTGDIIKYRIFAFDNVIDPSAPDAWPKAVFEAFESMNADGMIDEKMFESAFAFSKIQDRCDRVDAFASLMQHLIKR